MRSLSLASLLLGLVNISAALGRGHEVWKAQYPLEPGGKLSVENVQGDVAVQGWEWPRVEVEVVKTASTLSQHIDEVRIVVEQEGNSLALHTVYPPGLKEPIRVDYRLRVPRQVRLDALSTLQGNIAVQDVEGPIKAHCLSGDIRQVGVTGPVAARTIDGDIFAAIRSSPEQSRSLLLETVNGDVCLRLPAHTDADLEISTVAGRISSGYVLKSSSKAGDTVRWTRLGRGGVLISLRTVRGDIRVEEGGDVF